MTAPRLLFPLDKNYTLKEVQANCRSRLLLQMVELAKDHYLSQCNPLGIEDDPIKKIKSTSSYQLDHMETFYDELAGIYRYQLGSNQLEIIFSGKSHEEKYLDDWSEAFALWIKNFLTYPHFVRAALEMAIFYPQDRTAFLAGNRLKVFLTQYFQVRVYKYRGILPVAS